MVPPPPPPGPESPTSPAAHHSSEEEEEEDEDEEEDQHIVSDYDELEFRGQRSSYQASSILRRPDMFSLQAESSIDSEDY